MSAVEQLWFAVSIGGLLIFMNGAISLLTRMFIRILGKEGHEDYLKITVGVIILVLALWNLWPCP